MDPKTSKTSIASIPVAGNTFSSSSKLSIKSFTHHSFSVEIPTQSYGRSQVMPKSTLQKATILNEEEVSSFCEARFGNMADLQFDTMDMSYTDSSDEAPTILLRSADDHTTSDDTKGTIGEHSQTSGRKSLHWCTILQSLRGISHLKPFRYVDSQSYLSAIHILSVLFLCRFMV